MQEGGKGTLLNLAVDRAIRAVSGPNLALQRTRPAEAISGRTDAYDRRAGPLSFAIKAPHGDHGKRSEEALGFVGRSVCLPRL
jgi:hypothetical protein